MDETARKRRSAGIRATDAGTYEARYRDPLGRQRSRTFKRKTDATMFLAGVKAAMGRGEWSDPSLGRTTYEAWASRWMASNTHLRPKTVAGYESLLRSLVLPPFGAARLARIEPIEVKEWVSDLTERGLSASRIRQAYQLLSASLTAAVECGYLGRSPCVGVKLPRPTRRDMLFLTADQVEQLATAAVEPYGALIRFAAYTGMRFGEITALKVGRFDVLGARVRVTEAYSDVGGTLHLGPPKSGKERTVAVPRSICEELAPALGGRGPEELVFLAREGGPLRQGNFYHRQFKPAVERAGLDMGLRFHDLRHTCAALLIAQGAHPRAIMEHLGHSSISVTMDRYGHLFPDEKDRLARGLDEALRAARAAQDVGFLWGKRGGTVVSLDAKKQKPAPEQHL